MSTANRVIARHGSKYLARTSAYEHLEGPERGAALRILIKWPSEDAAKAFMQDPEYAPHLEARHAGSDSFHWLIKGQGDLA